MKKPVPVFAVFAVLTVVCTGLAAQSGASGNVSPAPVQTARIFPHESGIVRITQRYDLRRYLGGAYKGIFYGYSLGTWNVGFPGLDGSRPVKARYLMAGESGSDLNVSEKLIDGQLESTFTLGPDGTISGVRGGLTPYQRGFPAVPPAGTQAGQKWVAPIELVLPGDSFEGLKAPAAQATTLKLLAEYTLKRNAVWLGNPVVEVSAKYAVRYRNRQDPAGDPNLLNVEGTRDATIYLDPTNYSPIYTRERVGNEVYKYADGTTIRNEGFILTFYEGSIPMDRGNDGARIAGLLGGDPLKTDLASQTPGGGNGSATSSSPSPNPLQSPAPRQSPEPVASASPRSSPSPLPSPGNGTLIAAGSEGPKHFDELNLEDGPVKLNDMTVSDDPRGISISLENLRFEADKAVLLPGDEGRLDRIAAVLKNYPGRNILVIGHTAQVGSVESQRTLSLERARVIVEALKKRGIEPRRLLFEGRGGSEPVADNTTDAGRAANRRVQVIILD